MAKDLLLLDDLFDFDRKFYTFMRPEKDMMPYTVINKENQTVLIHNVVGINKEDLKNNNTDEVENENTYLNIINNIRSQYGLSNMNLNSSLDNSTRIRAIEISTFFDHIRPNGMDYDSVIDYYNSCSGENIAAGYNSVNDVINAWMNSQGHRDNILNPRYKFFSISSYNHNGMIYWDMLFSC